LVLVVLAVQLDFAITMVLVVQPVALQPLGHLTAISEPLEAVLVLGVLPISIVDMAVVVVVRVVLA
jgi:hypothetical protein